MGISGEGGTHKGEFVGIPEEASERASETHTHTHKRACGVRESRKKLAARALRDAQKNVVNSEMRCAMSMGTQAP